MRARTPALLRRRSSQDSVCLTTEATAYGTHVAVDTWLGLLEHLCSQNRSKKQIASLLHGEGMGGGYRNLSCPKRCHAGTVGRRLSRPLSRASLRKQHRAPIPDKKMQSSSTQLVFLGCLAVLKGMRATLPEEHEVNNKGQSDQCRAVRDKRRTRPVSDRRWRERRVGWRGGGREHLGLPTFRSGQRCRRSPRCACPRRRR